MTGFLLGVFFLSKLKLTNIMLSSRNRLAAGFTDTRLRPRYFRASIGGKATCASYSSLREWLTKDCKAENAEELLVVAEMPEISGLGLKATKAIRKGDEILSVPRSALIDAESARASLGDELADQLPEWALITVHLLAERALGTSSWWHPYLSSLPGTRRISPPDIYKNPHSLAITEMRIYTQLDCYRHFDSAFVLYSRVLF